MARPRKEPRIVRLRGRDNLYIRDGRNSFSTHTSSWEQAQWFLAEYLDRKKIPLCPTISQLLDLRLQDLKDRGVARASNTKHYHSPLKREMGGLRPQQITDTLIKSYWRKRWHVKAALREELFELRTTLKLAKKLKVIEEVPAIDIPAKPPSRDIYITEDQGATLLAHAKEQHLKLFLMIAMSTGARKGAILGLTWDRVYLERMRIDFNDPELMLTNKRRTVVPIGLSLAQVLTEAQQQAKCSHVIEYNGKPLKNIRTSFRQLVRSLDMPEITPHVLKHSVVSWLAMDGHSVDEIADLTATTTKTIKKIYRHFSPDYLMPVANTLDKKLSKNMSFANQFAKLPQNSDNAKVH